MSVKEDDLKRRIEMIKRQRRQLVKDEKKLHMEQTILEIQLHKLQNPKKAYYESMTK